MDLFEQKEDKSKAPLADRMRPRSLQEFLGQEEIIGPDQPLTRILGRGGAPPSIIFWGPAGSGKTTLARIIAGACDFHFVQFSAVTSGVKDVKRVVDEARYRRGAGGKGTILFVDEIHRFNRAQQDAFLPHIEDGTIILIGATTENPSFEVNSALLSRCRVFVLKPLVDEQVRAIVERAIADPERGLGSSGVRFEKEAVEAIVDLANGDARVALNLAEMTAGSGKQAIDAEEVRQSAQRRVLAYDKDREEHYNTISAFIKSLRGSDPDAALYWLARMLEAGEDPLFIARRMVIFASEDIGNADPRGILIANACKESVDFVGMPEGFLPLAQAATYLATAPKSNASYTAYLAAKEDVEKTRNDPVPLHLRNAPTGLMAHLGYHKGYQYPHSHEDEAPDQQYRPPNVAGNVYYRPKEKGYELTIRKLMEERRRNKKK